MSVKPTLRLLVGDALDQLRSLPDESVHCCVTSPPYWSLRDYGVDGQLGLEPTPELYVERMVAVFREVRRVLRADGTLWLNIGDSYASNSCIGRKDGGRPDTERARGKDGNLYVAPQAFRNVVRAGSGLKEKDLVGIPWLLAFALRQPYYTGRIRDERDRIWLAAMVEAEGCMFIHRRKAGTDSGAKFTKADGTTVSYARTQDTFGAGLEVASTDCVIVERCAAITGVGSICDQSPETNARRKQTIYRWNVRSNECRWIVSELYPHMHAKQHEARLLIGCPSSGDDARKAWESLKELHQGGAATIDFAPPMSLFEPGWYLRAENIWAKKNCMPESVPDRTTRSHEQMFLLAKSPRYFYDADAIREPASWDRWSSKQTTPKHTDNGNDRYAAFGREWTDDELARYRDGGRNKRSVWEIATEPYPEAHFATYPTALVEPCIRAGTSEHGVCPDCGAPWERVVEASGGTIGKGWHDHNDDLGRGQRGGDEGNVAAAAWKTYRREQKGWHPTCEHGEQPAPATVLDPFLGSGTTAAVALALGRNCIGIELNPEYAQLAEKRAHAWDHKRARLAQTSLDVA